jgi:hypothetical protein
MRQLASRIALKLPQPGLRLSALNRPPHAASQLARGTAREAAQCLAQHFAQHFESA